MATLPPPPQSPTVAAIFAWWQARPGRQSRRLGASQIGRECLRELWLKFRWANAGAVEFDGRMLRLFDRGHREEPRMIEELRGAGVEVFSHDPATGDQFTFTALGGHFVAKIDGVARGIVEAPKALHVLSFKTASAKRFADAVKATPPEHVAQNQVEMHLAQIERTFYLVANKDTDELHGARLRYDRAQAEALMAKAESVIFAPEPPARLSNDAAFWKCKGCAFNKQCHGQQLPAVSCRTCLHATPERDGTDGKWTCAKYDGREIPADFAPIGCGEHRYIPALVSWGEAVDASEAEGWVRYRMPSGHEFNNGASGPGSFTSKELHASTPALIQDSQFQAIRDAHGGTIVERAA